MIRNLKYIVFALVFGCLITVSGFAQEVIKGRVLEINGAPISGVTVEVQQTTRSTKTDANGNFSIAANSDDILVFSKSGFKTQKQATNLVSEVKMVQSKVDAGEDDMITIPFGERSKRELTYSVSTLKGDNLPQLPLSSLNNIFSGRLSGLNVQQNGSQPGNDNASLQIRGRSSYNSYAPRVLVDGILRDFSDMDLNEIESVVVLKDAASLAWYGLDGGNGVILVTTKKGSENKTEFSFDSQVGFQTPTKFIKPLNSFEYATLLNEAYTNIGQSPIYSNDQLFKYQSNADPLLFPNNNYVDEFLKPAAPVQRYVTSARGGNNTFRYYTLLSYFNQSGLFNSTKTPDYDSNTQFKRLNFRVNIDFDVNKNLTVGLNAGGRSEDRREAGGGTAALLNDIYNLPPNAFPILNADGSYGGTTLFTNNPLGRLQANGRTSNLSRVLFTNLTAKQKLDFVAKGLSANMLFSYDAQGNYQSGFTQNYEVFDFSNPTPVRSRVAAPLAYLGANFNNNNRRNEIWLGLDYDRVLGNHDIKGSLRFQRSVDNSVERLDFRGQQISARVDYGFKDRYYFGLVGSYSGSENFPPSKRYGFFPAVSAGWITSDEDFFKEIKIISYMKIRASYGEIGSGSIGGPRLPFRTLYNRGGTGGYVFGTGFGASTTASEVVPGGNPNVTWEQIKSFNVGTDLKLFKNSLELSLDYFNQDRTEILTGNSVPGILGISLAAQNGGQATSKGAEVTAIYHKMIGKVSTSFNGNFTYAKNQVVARNEDFGTLPYQSTIGFNTGDVAQVGTKRFLVSQGLFQNSQEIANSPTQAFSNTVLPGDIKYKDINGDNIINGLDAVNTNFTDIPNMYFGFGFNLNYKNFDFSTQFAGVQGRTIQIRTIINSGPSNLNEFSKERWTAENASTARWPRLSITDRANNDQNSDFWLRSGDFLKLRTLEFGYTVPSKLSKVLKIQKARLYLGGYNLLTFSQLDIDVDPEMPFAGFGSSYPYLKTYTLGLNVQF